MMPQCYTVEPLHVIIHVGFDGSSLENGRLLVILVYSIAPQNKTFDVLIVTNCTLNVTVFFPFIQVRLMDIGAFFAVTLVGPNLWSKGK